MNLLSKDWHFLQKQSINQQYCTTILFQYLLNISKVNAAQKLYMNVQGNITVTTKITWNKRSQLIHQQFLKGKYKIPQYEWISNNYTELKK